MRTSEGEIIREGDILCSCYGIPPRKIEGEVYKAEYGGRRRTWVYTPGHNPEHILLSDFIKALGNVYLKRRKIDGQTLLSGERERDRGTEGSTEAEV